MPEFTGSGVRWSLDFLSGDFGEARRYRILAAIDDYTQDCLAMVVTRGFPAHVFHVSWTGSSGSPASPK